MSASVNRGGEEVTVRASENAVGRYYATIRVEASRDEGEVWYRASLFNFTGMWWREPRLAVQSLISGMPSSELVKLLTKLGVEITAVVTPEISKICIECGLPMVEGTTTCPICGH